MTYAIYEDFFPDVEKKLNRIAKKCIKHGNDFTFEVNGEEIREMKNQKTGRKENYKFILIEVKGTAKIDDWECVAVLEINNAGNIIRRINTEIEIPERFRSSDDYCEHCNSKRHRNNLYVIHNVMTDEWKQVGGNCLALYTHGLNMEYVSAYMNGITELEEHDGVFGVNGKPYFFVEEVISYAVEIIAKTGYFNAQSNLPTKELVSWLLYRTIDKAIEEINDDLKNEKIVTRFGRNDFFKPDTDSLVKEIIEYYKSLEDDCEFIHNVHVMLNEGYVQVKNIGFLCYLPEGYARHIKKDIEEAKRAEKKAKPEYFGEVGKRYKDKSILSINLITLWDTQWGVTYLYKVVLESGESLIWKTSNSLFFRRWRRI